MNDTPVDTPRVTQADVWRQTATHLKRDGYNGAVVARKMISIYGMNEADAETLVGELFGKAVNARAGDTTQAVVIGLALTAAGALGAVTPYALLDGFRVSRGIVGFELLCLGIVGKGLSQVFIALMNRDVKGEG